MKIGRNILEDNYWFTLVVHFDGDKTPKNYNFDTHLKAVRAMNKFRRNGANYFDAHTDPTL